MPTGTTYKPIKVADFESSKLNHNGLGTSMVIATAGTQNLDVALTDDHLLTGCWLLIENGVFGDTANFQIIDTAGLFTGTAGTVLNQFITGWVMPDKTMTQFDIPYPAKIYGGMTLRIVYTTTGTNVLVGVNYKLHKVLI